MKALLILLVLVLTISSGFSQLAQERIVDGNIKLVSLDNGESKYLQYQEKENNLNILNLDHSIWKSVQLPLPKGHFLDEVKLVSTKIFNQDYLVEILYTSTVYNYSCDSENPNSTEDFISFTLNIINENGEVLLKEEKSQGYKITELEAKNILLIYKDVNNGFKKEAKSIIYTTSPLTYTEL